MDVDERLARLGRFGHWQVRGLLLVGLSANAVLSWNIMVIVFLGEAPEFQCGYNKINNRSLASYKHSSSHQSHHEQCYVLGNDTNTSVSCRDGWEYELTHGPTIVSEWDLVCEQNYLVELSQMLFMLGLGLSDFFITAIADYFGRKKAHIISTTLSGLIGIIVAFVPNYPAFTVLRFFTGILADGAYGTGMVWISEHFSSHTRAFASSLSLFFWGIAKCLLSLMSYLIPNWRYLQLAISVLSLTPITFIWLLDESVPWLAASGKSDQAQKVLDRAAKLNKIQAYDVHLRNHCVISECEIKEEETTKMNITDHDSNKNNRPPKPKNRDNVLSVFRHPMLCRSLALVSFVLLINNVAYHGVILALGSMAGNLHLNFLVCSVIDTAASAMVCLVSKRWGRLPTIIAGQMTAGAGLITCAFMPPITGSGVNLTPLITTVFMLAFLGSATSFATICAYGPELFPTRVRNLSYGMVMTFGRIGGIASPLYGLVGKYIPWLPALLVGVVTVVSGFTSMALPETSKRPLFQSIAEMDEWIQNSKIKSRSKKKKKQTKEESMI